MSHPLRISELLSSADREALEAFTREKHRTVDTLFDWIRAHGYVCGRSAVYSWRTKFISEDRFRASNEVARALADAAKQSGGVAIAEAATLQLQTMLFEAMLRMQAAGKIEPKDLWAIAAAHKSAASTQRLVADLRDETDKRQKLAAAEAQKVAKEGGSADAVVAKVREILGIAA